MRVIKFRDTTINGVDESTLNWTKVTDKDELMVEVFTSEKLFEDLSIYWKELEKRADNTIYMSYDWVYNWWQHFGKNEQRSLFIVTFWDGTKLVGVAPLYKGYSKFGSVILERRLQIIGSGGSRNEQLGYRNDYGISPSLDLIVDRSYSTPVADLLAEDILTHKFLGADVLTLPHARDDSFIMNYLYPRLQDRIPQMRLKQTNICSYIDLNQKESIHEPQSSVGDHLQHLIEVGDNNDEYDIEDVSDTMGHVVEAVENLIELQQGRADQLTGVFYEERFIQFFKEILRKAFKNNWLWFKQAKNDGGVCASRVALYYNGRYYDYIKSEIETSLEDGPARGLFADLIKDGIKKGAQRVEVSKIGPKHNADYGSSFNTWTLRIPLRERKKNVPFLLNRIGAFLYKCLGRERRLLNIQRKKRGILKMFPGYLNFRLKGLGIKLTS